MLRPTQEHSWEASAPAGIFAAKNDYPAIAARCQRHLYVTAWRILRNHDEAEETVQEAHVRALSRLHQFSGRAALSTWLTKIVINEALTRLRRNRHSTDLDSLQLRSMTRDPEEEALRGQFRRILLSAVGALPLDQQTVFVLREVWELNTAETAERLGLTVECVKTRLHRAKSILRRRLGSRFQRTESV